MNLAQFILDRHFGDTSAYVRVSNKPSPVVHEKKKKVKRVQFVSMRNKHCARCPGINQGEYGWRVVKTVNGKTILIGDFYSTFLRARMGQKMYEYWVSKGFTVDEIPRVLSPRYSQHGKKRT